jgi:heme-degrading monooxygenase HmoA
MIVVMVRIPASGEGADGMVERFRNRAGLVDKEPGFLGFELLKGEDELISVTRWATRADLDRWMASGANAEAHRRGPTEESHSHGSHGGHSGHEGHEGHGHGHGGGAPQQRGPGGSVTVYEVVIGAEGGA